MKKLLFLLYILMLSGCFSTTPIQESQLTTQYVVDLKGMSPETIYGKSLDYIAYTYKDAKAVINVQDKDRCKIIGKGIGPKYHERALVDPNLSYTFTIQCKADKARISFSNLMADRWHQGQHFVYPPHLTNQAEVQGLLDESAKQFEEFFKAPAADNW